MSRSKNSRRGTKRGRSNRSYSPTPYNIRNSLKLISSFCNPTLSARLCSKENIAIDGFTIKKEIERELDIKSFINIYSS